MDKLNGRAAHVNSVCALCALPCGFQAYADGASLLCKTFSAIYPSSLTLWTGAPRPPPPPPVELPHEREKRLRQSMRLDRIVADKVAARQEAHGTDEKVLERLRRSKTARRKRMREADPSAKYREHNGNKVAEDLMNPVDRKTKEPDHSCGE